MKTLSQKTLEKEYAELGLPRETLDLLHDYFLCFSNFYGVISVRDAWNVFKNYEGINLLHKKDFAAFSGIVRREPGHPYSVLELKEVYTDETTEDPLERLIVNNRLIGDGYGKYSLLYNTVDRQQEKPYYLPADKSSFLANIEDRFYLSPDGKQMVRFLGKLKTDGKYKDYDGVPRGDLLDLDGNTVAGKCLSDFLFYTYDEQSDIDYFKSEAKKERLRLKYRTTALDKILNRIFINIQTGGHLPVESPANKLMFLADYLNHDLGAVLTKAQLERFIRLYMDLNNHSHLWLNCGWRPDEMPRGNRSDLPDTLSAGPNLKRLFDEGKMDRKEFEQQLKTLGIKLTKE